MSSRRALGPLVWVATLGAAAVALQWSGHGALAPPPLGHPGRWVAWVDGRDPGVAAFSLVRVLAVAGLWYLVATTAVGVLLRAAGAVRMVAVCDRLTVAPVRRLLAGVSLGLAATTLAPVAALARQPAPVAATPAATVTMHLLGPAEPAPGPAHELTTAAALAAAPAPAPAPVPDPARWTVQPGQCFWTIAESVLARAWGRPPSDAEIVPYWRRLISANVAVLAHADNPDLIFPGQVFEIPVP